MRCIIQTVSESNCVVNQAITGEIKNGYLILVGFTNGDDTALIEKVVSKIIKLRVFEDEQGKMNKSIIDVNGSILSISQFTLYADLKKGNRPSFTDALESSKAKILYNYFNECLIKQNVMVETGIFGADMLISLVNVGPKTFIIDTKDL